MDYGKKDPSLGWRFTDAWLSMAGAGDVGIPNGLPVHEWGIRVEGCRPVGSTVERGGATDGPAAVYSLTKYVDWLKAYAPPEAAGMVFSEAGPVPARHAGGCQRGGRLPAGRQPVRCTRHTGKQSNFQAWRLCTAARIGVRAAGVEVAARRRRQGARHIACGHGVGAQASTRIGHGRGRQQGLGVGVARPRKNRNGDTTHHHP